MDDMKQLIEKYKRELIEYSKAAPPKEKLEFPEMLSSEQPEEPLPPENQSLPPEEPAQPPQEVSPQIIGYSDSGDIPTSFDEVFALYGDTAEQQDLDGVSTVTPEAAERLDDVPQSGQDDDEQLAKRDFSEEQPQVNSPDDIAPLERQGEAVAGPAEKDYTSLEDYNDMNNRTGTLRFRTYTASGALPVEGASIEVFKQINGERQVFYSLVTDISGLTAVISLPAPPKELSETPNSPVQPYAMYNADIRADGYNDVAIRDLPVFEGVLSLQSVPLVPDIGQQTDVIVEREPALNGGTNGTL